MGSNEEEALEEIVEKQNILLGTTKSALRIAKDMQREVEKGARRAAKVVDFVNRQGRLSAGALLFISAAFQLLTPKDLVRGGHLFMPAIEIILGTIFFVWQTLFDKRHLWLRRITVSLSLFLSMGNAISIGFLIELLVSDTKLNAIDMLLAAGSVWFTNVVAFALLYWEFDRGGPLARVVNGDANADFFFPQMELKKNDPELPVEKRVVHPDWQPHYFDYLFLALSTSSAFSATDTMPLTWRAKLLTGIQAVVSLLTISLVAARAVNILK